MRSVLLGVILYWLAASPTVRAGVAPIPESDQAPRALKIIDAYDGPGAANPARVLRIIYFTPSDREPVPQYAARLESIFEDLRQFYQTEMARNGFGPKTFRLDRDASDKLVIHLIKGKETTDYYAKNWEDRHHLIADVCASALLKDGIQFSNETATIVCNLANWDEKSRAYSHPAPYTGTWSRTGGFCWFMDSPILDIKLLHQAEPVVEDFQFGKIPMGRRNSMFIGSIGHELGHALGMPHSGERWDERKLGKSIMGMGNLQYRLDGPGKGAFLNMAGAMRLAARPFFRNSNKGLGEVPKIEKVKLRLSTKVTRPDLIGRPGAFRLEGTVKGEPPVYGVIAYFDSVHDGGYRSPAATSVPDEDGNFAIEISDLKPCKDGKVTVSFCHANGTTSARVANFKVP